MSNYKSHFHQMPQIRKAISQYQNGCCTQQAAADNNNITLTTFRYYYHNTRRMNELNKNNGSSNVEITHKTKNEIQNNKWIKDMDNYSTESDQSSDSTDHKPVSNKRATPSYKDRQHISSNRRYQPTYTERTRTPPKKNPIYHNNNPPHSYIKNKLDGGTTLKVTNLEAFRANLLK